jgi:GR25 family glycosyltransferase involved in LPS biosynthesis
MDRLSKVIYINCDHRTDRKQEIEAELRQKFEYDKAERLEATLHEIPIFGCTISHVRIWRRMIQEGWESALILEDDAKLQVSRKELDGYINAFLDDERADMLHIANSTDNIESYPTTDSYFPPINRRIHGLHNHLSDTNENPKCACRNGDKCNGVLFYTPRFLRTFNTNTSACYVVKKSQVHALLNAYTCDLTTGVHKGCDSDHLVHVGSVIDTTWNPLLATYTWLVPNVPPYARIAIQRPGYSDIQRIFTDYKV